MPIKPPPPTSPSHNLHHQQGIRSPVPLKQYAPVTSPASEAGRGGAPLQQNNTLINNSQHQQQNSSTPQNSTNAPQHPPISLANNNQLRPTPTGNGNTPPNSRMSLTSAGGGGKGDISPSRVRQSTPSPKSERYSNMNAGDRKQTPATISSTNETTVRQGTSPGKQNSPNANNSPIYQNKSVGNSNNLSVDQQPTIKRPRKGSGGVHSKQQQSQQPSHHGTSHMDNVSR